MEAIALRGVFSKQPPLAKVGSLRERAQQHLDRGAVTAGYGADRENVIEALNEALATELVCVLRYKRHYFCLLYTSRCV